MNDVQKLLGVPPEEPVLPEEGTEESREKLSPSQSSTEVRIHFNKFFNTRQLDPYLIK